MFILRFYGVGSDSTRYAGLQQRSYHHKYSLNMQIKRLLDDREVFAGDRLFDAQGRSYAFVEHFDDKLAAKAEGEHRFT